MAIELEVNGMVHRLDVDPRRSLLDLLRNDLGLMGTKYGCGEGQCGACKVLLEGRAVRSCITPVSAAAWRRVTTVEGLERDGGLHPVQQAFLDEQALQCGYCTTGMIMGAVALLRSNPDPSETEIVEAMNDHVCRCGTYPRVVAAVRRAAGAGRAGALTNPESRQSTSEREEEHYAPRDVELKGAESVPRRESVKAPTGGLVVVSVTRDPYGAPGSMGVPLESGAADREPASESVGAWVHIGKGGAVTAGIGKVEVGQGIRTSLTQEVAEELNVSVDVIRLVMGDTDRSPFDSGTFGSRSTPQAGTQLRRAAAGARNVLVGMAAERWGVSPDGLECANGWVLERASGRSLGYGQLTAGQERTEVVRDDDELALTPAERWQVAGKPIHRTTGRDVVTGRHCYPWDLRMPGMLTGKVLRPPAIGARLERLDTAAASEMPGVSVAHEDGFVGVAAPSLGEALRGLGAIDAHWVRTPQPSQAELWEHLRNVRPKEVRRRGEWGGPASFEEGDAERGKREADHVLARTYTVAYIAHVPLEPRAAVAEWGADGALTVWTGTQRPFGVQEELSDAFGMPAEKVRVIVPDTGSGYGGKHTSECALEAARLARAAGAPVKVAWTREEEFRWAYFRPAGVIDVVAGIRADGTLTSWELDNYNSGAAAIRSLYIMPARRLEYHASDSPLRQGSYRALAATANNFAREMHLDELAAIVGLDPLELRLRNLADERMKAALRAAAERFGWHGPGAAPPSRGHGIAGCFEKGGYVATCAEVSVGEAGEVRVERVVTAFDCGAVVNPDNLKNQIVGATIQGLGGALLEEIDFDDGVIKTDRLSLYRVPRFRDVPQIEAVLLDRKDQPSAGAGETPLVALAPAIGAAMAAATGVRVRDLPLARRKVAGGEAPRPRAGAEPSTEWVRP